MKKRNGFTVMTRLIGLVKPLAGFMVLAIFMGLIGHLCAAFITVFGGYAILDLAVSFSPFAIAVTSNPLSMASFTTNLPTLPLAQTTATFILNTSSKAFFRCNHLDYNDIIAQPCCNVNTYSKIFLKNFSSCF